MKTQKVTFKINTLLKLKNSLDLADNLHQNLKKEDSSEQFLAKDSDKLIQELTSLKQTIETGSTGQFTESEVQDLLKTN